MLPLTFAPNLPYASQSTPHQQVQQRQFGGLSIEAESISEDFETGLITAKGKVRAKYLVTEITADELIIDEANKSFQSVGKTQLTDPEGIISCHNLFYDWGQSRGSAEDVVIRIESVVLTCEKIEIEPGDDEIRKVYVLRKAKFSLKDIEKSGSEFWADEIRIYPGDYAIAKRAFFHLLGAPLGPIPEVRFNLDQRVTGFKLPDITDRRSVGLGISWDMSFLLSRATGMAFAAGIFPGQAPNLEIEVVSSMVDPVANPHKIVLRDDLDERAEKGYFTTVENKSSADEFSYLRQNKNRFSISTRWNVPTYGRVMDEKNVSKLLELGYESGGTVGEFGYLFTSKVHRIRKDPSSAWVDRSYSILSLSAPQIDFDKNWKLRSRVDLIGSFGSQDTFGIARGEFGVVGEFDDFAIGLAYIAGQEFGTPDFAFDQLGPNRTLNARIDYVQGPYIFRYLARYDLATKQIFDKQFELAFAAGSFEPFVLSRENPSDFRIGVRFRINSFRDKILNREVERKK